MTINENSTRRKRSFCIVCGRVHRNPGQCGEQRQDPAPSLAQVPDQDPYPYTSGNLSKSAAELLINAGIKESQGFQQQARHCRQLAARRLREAGELTPEMADYYEQRALGFEQDAGQCNHASPRLTLTLARRRPDTMCNSNQLKENERTTASLKNGAIILGLFALSLTPAAVMGFNGAREQPIEWVRYAAMVVAGVGAVVWILLRPRAGGDHQAGAGNGTAHRGRPSQQRHAQRAARGNHQRGEHGLHQRPAGH